MVGNFSYINTGISAFDPVTGAFLGTIPIDAGIGNTPGGLWALGFGSGAATAIPTPFTSPTVSTARHTGCLAPYQLFRNQPPGP